MVTKVILTYSTRNVPLIPALSHRNAIIFVSAEPDRNAEP